MPSNTPSTKVSVAFGVALALGLAAGSAAAGPVRGKPSVNHGHHNTNVNSSFSHNSSGFSETSPTRSVPQATDLRPLSGQELRARFDRNANNTLDASERTLAEAFLDQRRRQFEARLMQRFDRNRDGALSPAERLDAKAALRVDQLNNHNALVSAFDANNDGILDLAEQATAKANDPQRFFDVRFYSGAPKIFAAIQNDGFGPAHAGVYTD
ncbi:MAG: hypothetical protein AAF995_00195 [Planctomycetota bacterium]